MVEEVKEPDMSSPPIFQIDQSDNQVKSSPIVRVDMAGFEESKND